MLLGTENALSTSLRLKSTMPVLLTHITDSTQNEKTLRRGNSTPILTSHGQLLTKTTLTTATRTPTAKRETTPTKVNVPQISYESHDLSQWTPQTISSQNSHKLGPSQLNSPPATQSPPVLPPPLLTNPTTDPPPHPLHERTHPPP